METKETPEGRGFVELVARGIVDKDFRKELLAHPDDYIEQYGLSKSDALALKDIDEGRFEAASSSMNEKAAWVIAIGWHGHFD